MIKPLSKRMIGIMSQGTYLVSWKELEEGDAGEPFEFHSSEQRSIQFCGTFGPDGAICLEGSHDGLSWVTLTDPQGNPISKMGPGIESVTELAVFVRPRVKSGDTSTLLSAHLLVKESL